MHGIQQVTGLVADGLQCRASKFRRAGAARQAEHRAACFGIPPGGAETDEGGHEIDFLRIVCLVRKRPGFRCGADHLQPVAQPLNRRTCNEDRALQRVIGLAVQTIGDRRQQPVLGANDVLARVQKRKAACSIGGFQHAGREAGLADDGGMLISGDTQDRNFRAKQVSIGNTEVRSAIQNFRQDGFRHIENVEKFLVPDILLNVEHQRARGIGGVGHEGLAARQPPDEEGIDRAEAKLALLRPLARALHIGEQPGKLGAGKVRVEQQTGALGENLLMPGLLQLVAKLARTSILPDNGIVQRLAGFAIPDQRRLTLVGDADGGDVGALETGFVQRLLDRPDDRFPDFLRIVLHPTGIREDLPKLLLACPGYLHGLIEDDRARGRGALVNGDNVAAHSFLPEISRAHHNMLNRQSQATSGVGFESNCQFPRFEHNVL